MAEARKISPLTLKAWETGLPKPWMAVIEGARLRKLRTEAGLSQKELSNQSGVGLKIVKRLEGQEEGLCLPRTGGLLAEGLGLDDAVALVRELVTHPSCRRARE